jgi:hypothetical protein
VIAALEQAWRETCAARGAKPPAKLHVLKLGTAAAYTHPAAPIVLLLFGDRNARPLAAAKLARVAAGDAIVEAEAAHLAMLRPRLPSPMAASVPEVLASGRVNGRAFVLCTALAGAVELHHTWDVRCARRAATRIGAALGWIAAAAAAAPAAAIDCEDWLGPLDAALATLSELGLDASTASRLHRRLGSCWRTPWPAGLAHGDYFPGNLLFARGDRVGVVDWSMASVRMPLHVDPLTYELSFGLHALAANGRREPGDHRALHAFAPFVAARRRLSELGIDVSLGGDARLVAAVGGVLREAAAGPDRRATVARWVRLLELETSLA